MLVVVVIWLAWIELVVKRETDTALILDPTMTMAEELKEYLLFILGLPEAKVEHLVNVFRSNQNKL